MEKKNTNPRFPPRPLSKKFETPPSQILCPPPPNRVLAYFTYLYQLFINRAMTCTCDLWPVTCILYLPNFMFHLNLYQDLLNLLDDLSYKLNPLITITNITCFWDHRFLRNSLKFKLNLNYNVIKYKLTSQDPYQIFHDFCHAKCENFWIMNKAKCWRVSKRTAEAQIRVPEV